MIEFRLFVGITYGTPGAEAPGVFFSESGKGFADVGIGFSEVCVV